MSELLPCPFCGGTNTQARESTHWTGRSTKLISVTIMHWCDDSPISNVLQRKGKTHEEAIANWNKRTGD